MAPVRRRRRPADALACLATLACAAAFTAPLPLLRHRQQHPSTTLTRRRVAVNDSVSAKERARLAEMARSKSVTAERAARAKARAALDEQWSYWQNRYASWVSSTSGEENATNLKVEGALPAWLRGELCHVAPAQFECGEQALTDWVDGQAMIFQVGMDGAVAPSSGGDSGAFYQNKFLDTENKRAHDKAGKIGTRETCSRPRGLSFKERLKVFGAYSPNQNANLHVSKLAGRNVAMSVATDPMEWDPKTLATHGSVKFDDALAEELCLLFYAEPHVHSDGTWFSNVISLAPNGFRGEYVLFSVAPGATETGAPLQREIIAKIPSSGNRPSPVHNVILTEKYMIIAEIPYPINVKGVMKAEFEWLLTGEYSGEITDYASWEPWRPTVFHVVDRHTGEVVAHREAEAFFFFHTVNAYEKVDEATGKVDVVVDLVAFKEPPRGFNLHEARSGSMEGWGGDGEGGQVKRFTLRDIGNEGPSTLNVGEPQVLLSKFDEPQVSPAAARRPYKYCYGIANEGMELILVKHNVETGETTRWAGQDRKRHMPWQPIYVQKPGSDVEDDGVLLCLTRDSSNNTSFVVVLDAHSFEELGKVWLPEGHHIPLHAHGMFQFKED